MLDLGCYSIIMCNVRNLGHGLLGVMPEGPRGHVPGNRVNSWGNGVFMLKIMTATIDRLKLDDRGLTSVEYAVLGGLIVAALTTMVGLFTGELSTAFQGLID